jgi:hypothetical protein
MIFNLCPENQQKNFDSPCQPFWVDYKILDKLWSRHDLYYPSKGINELKFRFFWYRNIDGILLDEPYFYFGRASVYEYPNNWTVLGFSDGRHRTRWMLDLGLRRIPLALSSSSIELAKKELLIIDPIEKGATIELPVTIAEIQINEREYYNRGINP